MNDVKILYMYSKHPLQQNSIRISNTNNVSGYISYHLIVY